MNKPKVLHINASSEGGASIVAQRLNEGLNQLGLADSQHLVFSGKKYEGASPYGYTLIADNLAKRVIAFLRHALDKLDFLRYEASKSVRFQFSHASQGVDICSHPLVKQADIIHLHWVHKGFQSFDTLEKLLKLPKKFVWTCHDLWPVTGGCYYNWGCENHLTGCGNCKYLKHPSPKDLSSALIQKKVHLWGNNQIRFITPSQWLADQGKNSIVMKNNLPFAVIPNPIDTNDFSPPDEAARNILKIKNGFREGIPVILFSAAYLRNPAKGFSHFVSLCNTLKHQNISFQALIIGDAKGVDMNFDFPFVHWGYVANKQRIMEAFQVSDLYVITSVQDNLPTTVMESLALGTPVAGFRVGGIPELVDENENGFLTEVNDVAGLAAHIMEYLGNDNRRRAFRENARRKALTTFDVSVVAKQMADLYISL